MPQSEIIPGKNTMQAAAIAMNAIIPEGRDALRSTAILQGWLAARQTGVAATEANSGGRGATPADCDAIVDAALDAVFERLAMWAAETD